MIVRFSVMLSAVMLALSAMSAAATTDEPAFADSIVASDDELAQSTGKFLLPNGAELAMSITSDTVVDGHLILRTVLTVDTASQLQVFGRQNSSSNATYAMGDGDASIPVPTGVSVMFDRRSGLQSVTPTFGVSGGGTSVTTAGQRSQNAADLGVTLLSVVQGGAPVQTDDGTVMLSFTGNGSQQVTLNGDQLGVAHIVGQSIANVVANSANDRTIDTVTNVNIDLRDVTPFAAGSGALRIDGMMQDITSRLAR